MAECSHPPQQQGTTMLDGNEPEDPRCHLFWVGLPHFLSTDTGFIGGNAEYNSTAAALDAIEELRKMFERLPRKVHLEYCITPREYKP